MSPRRGPDLPYSVVAAVTPSASRWLVASAKVQGSTFAPEPPKVYETFNDVLDERPSFASIVVNAPIGFRDTLDQGPRTCDARGEKTLQEPEAGLSTTLLCCPPSFEVPRRPKITSTRLPHTC